MCFCGIIIDSAGFSLLLLFLLLSLINPALQLPLPPSCWKSHSSLGPAFNSSRGTFVFVRSVSPLNKSPFCKQVHLFLSVREGLSSLLMLSHNLTQLDLLVISYPDMYIVRDNLKQNACLPCCSNPPPHPNSPSFSVLKRILCTTTPRSKYQKRYYQAKYVFCTKLDTGFAFTLPRLQLIANVLPAELMSCVWCPREEHLRPGREAR